MMQYPYYGYNPMVPGQTQKRLEDLQREIANLQNMNNQMFAQSSPTPNVPSMNNNDTGTYVYVQDYQQVVGYPTPTDGRAVLFINLDKGIGWSKKFENGSNVIQSFTIRLLNTYENSNNNNTPTEDEPENHNVIMNNLLERLTTLEDNFEKIFDALKGREKPNEIQSKTNTQRGQNGIQPSTSR